MHREGKGLVAAVLPGGEGIVRHQDADIFITNVVTGDHIRFQNTQKRRGVLRGELLEVLTPSKDRITPPCPVASECGGCALQSMTQSSQSVLKEAWVQHAFHAFITKETYVHKLNSETYNFSGRRRVRWFIDGFKLGFRKRSSHQFIHTPECMALTQELNDLRNNLETSLHTYPKTIESIQAVQLSNGFHVIFESKIAFQKFILPNINPAKPIQYWWRKLDSQSTKALNSPVLPLFDQIPLKPYHASTIDMQIGPNDFIQGHQQGNQTLIHQILTWSKGSQRIVDLFSGCGNLSLPIAAAFGVQVAGAEVNPSSVQAANNNAKRLKLNATYQAVDLFGKFNIEPFIAADTIIIDPPRKGAKRICKMIQQFFPKQIIMVNCDAAAGARDAQALQQAGFTLKAIRPLDLFPYTGHVEVMSLWTS